MNNTETALVYVELLEEGTATIRSTQAKRLPNSLFELLPTPDYDPEDEIWQFLPGSIVRCKETLNYKGEKILLAVEQVG